MTTDMRGAWLLNMIQIHFHYVLPELISTFIEVYFLYLESEYLPLEDLNS